VIGSIAARDERLIPLSDLSRHYKLKEKKGILPPLRSRIKFTEGAAGKLWVVASRS
jgi:hypothetical protein